MSRAVLVVDDTASVRRLVCLILRAAGYTVIEASNGREAMERLSHREKRVEMVITDLMMPVMDGIGLIQSLRADSRYREIPVIMLTSEMRRAHESHEGLHGADNWIMKPFIPKQLLDVVRELQERKRSRLPVTGQQACGSGDCLTRLVHLEFKYE